MVTSNQADLIKLICRTLERISDAEQMIGNLQIENESETNFSLRQYKHLKARLTKDLHGLLQKFDGNLHVQYIERVETYSASAT